jgi:two-component system, NtrC family, response regulator HydG
MNTMSVHVPALAERREDIPLLVGHFLEELSRPDMQPTQEAWDILKNYDWPGNVRELKNAVERGVSLADGSVLCARHLPDKIKTCPKPPARLSVRPDTPLIDEMAAYEKALLADRLRHFNHNMSKLSKSLRISRSTLYEKCRRHNLV